MFKSKVFWSLNQTHWCSTRHVHVNSISSAPVILAYTHRSKDTRRIHLDACNVSSSDFEYFVVSETMSNAKAYISFWFGLLGALQSAWVPPTVATLPISSPWVSWFFFLALFSPELSWNDGSLKGCLCIHITKASDSFYQLLLHR